MKHIAWASPLPPTPSGIADYSLEIINAIVTKSRNVRITCVLDEYDEYPCLGLDFSALRPEINYVSTRHFVHNLIAEKDSYDAVIVQLGSSKYHVYQYALLAQLQLLGYPRERIHVVVHDYPLAVAPYALSQTPHRFAFWLYYQQRLIAERISAEDAALLMRVAYNVESEKAELNYILASSALDAAKHVYTHHPEIVRLLKVYADVEAKVFALGAQRLFARAQVSARELLSDYLRLEHQNEKLYVIGIFGYIAPNKRVEEAVQLALAIREARKERTLILLVGEIVEQYKNTFAIPNAPDVYHFSGVSPEQWHFLMNACDLGIQFRDDKVNAASRVVAQWLAYHKPVLVSDTLRPYWCTLPYQNDRIDTLLQAALCVDKQQSDWQKIWEYDAFEQETVPMYLKIIEELDDDTTVYTPY
ncbi:MAG: hypothetical protein D6712_20860 [Chloroflexi bacterium]|nr:MAG: hypothetical protein D6712_20860 [Chloroflexota bacterium]